MYRTMWDSPDVENGETHVIADKSVELLFCRKMWYSRDAEDGRFVLYKEHCGTPVLMAPEFH
jgi:hypothetical protein